MLLRFRITNYASIRDEVELSFIALNDHSDLAIQQVEQAGVKVLPVAAIYGANGSGKSNVIDAFVFMRYVIRSSHQDWRPGAPINRRPFKLDEDSKRRPTVFIVNFVLEGVHYEYGFSIDDHRVLSEWLYSYPKKRPRLFFERSESSGMKFGSSLKGRRTNIADLTRPNSLYLSAAAANNHDQLTAIYKWFMYDIFPIKASTDLDDSYTVHEWLHHDQDRERLRSLLRYADTGVTDLEIEEQEVPDTIAEKFREFMEVYDPEHAQEGQLGSELNVNFIHTTGPSSAPLSLEEESSGTLAWVRLIGPIIVAIRRGGILVVDELDAYLHPLLAAHLVEIFQDPKNNPSGAQLLFNTHDVTLLAPSAPSRLRRDEVWFTEKDSEGVTRLTPLIDYRVRDGLENVEKRYLNGRYGGVPFLDDTVLESIRSE